MKDYFLLNVFRNTFTSKLEMVVIFLIADELSPHVRDLLEIHGHHMAAKLYSIHFYLIW